MIDSAALLTCVIMIIIMIWIVMFSAFLALSHREKVIKKCWLCNEYFETYKLDENICVGCQVGMEAGLRSIDIDGPVEFVGESNESR